MGVEMSFQIPGGPLAVAAASPRLAFLRVGPDFALVWGEPGYTLQSAESLDGPWLPVAAVSPVLVPSTNPAAFFRLRR